MKIKDIDPVVWWILGMWIIAALFTLAQVLIQNGRL